MKAQRGSGLDSLDSLIEQIMGDAYSDIEQLWAFRQAFEDEVVVPCDAFVIGERVMVIKCSPVAPGGPRLGREGP